VFSAFPDLRVATEQPGGKNARATDAVSKDPAAIEFVDLLNREIGTDEVEEADIRPTASKEARPDKEHTFFAVPVSDESPPETTMLATGVSGETKTGAIRQQADTEEYEDQSGANVAQPGARSVPLNVVSDADGNKRTAPADVPVKATGRENEAAAAGHESPVRPPVAAHHRATENSDKAQVPQKDVGDPVPRDQPDSTMQAVETRTPNEAKGTIEVPNDSFKDAPANPGNGHAATPDKNVTPDKPDFVAAKDRNQAAAADRSAFIAATNGAQAVAGDKQTVTAARDRNQTLSADRPTAAPTTDDTRTVATNETRFDAPVRDPAKAVSSADTSTVIPGIGADQPEPREAEFSATEERSRDPLADESVQSTALPGQPTTAPVQSAATAVHTTAAPAQFIATHTRQAVTTTGFERENVRLGPESADSVATSSQAGVAPWQASTLPNVPTPPTAATAIPAQAQAIVASSGMTPAMLAATDPDVEFAREAVLFAVDPGASPGGSERLSDSRSAVAPSQQSAPVPGSALAREITQAALSSRNGNTIDLFLDPVELGKLEIEISVVDDRMSILVRADREDALDLMRRNSDELHRLLREADVDLETLTFSREQSRGQDQQRDWKNVAFGGTADAGGDETVTSAVMPDSSRLDIRI